MRRFLAYLILVIVIIGAGVIYYRYYRVFGEGMQSGELNYVVKKGYVFQTFEGKLIQPGFRSKTPGSIQSYEFEFSVVDKGIADKLMLSSGKEVLLHYKEYIGSIPWRGYNRFIVDSIYSIKEPQR